MRVVERRGFRQAIVVRKLGHDAERNRLEGKRLYVSKIFKWFAEDFNDDVVGFFLRFADAEIKEKLTADKDKIKVKYLDYDWSLNGT